MERKARNKITEEMVIQSFEVGKKIKNKEITFSSGIDKLENCGMKRTSAADYVYSYKKLTSGEKFDRTTNAFATNYFLERILLEDGREGLEIALKSLSAHISYYETKSPGKVGIRKKIHDKYLAKLQSLK